MEDSVEVKGRTDGERSDPAPDVATALVDLNAGEEIDIEIPQKGSQRIALKEAIQLGHKFALQPIGRGAGVLKCGMSIPMICPRTRNAVRLTAKTCVRDRWRSSGERYLSGYVII